jgi:DNA-binding SARP family transcriptional activator
MDFRILGPIEVMTAAGPVALGGPRQDRILAALLTRAGKFVATDQMVDILWPNYPPATARAQVQNCVSALRRQLASVGLMPVQLTRSGSSYSLIPGEQRLDLDRFNSIRRRARGLVACGHIEDGIRHLREAEALWRGPALGGLADGFLEGESVRLSELRLEALEERIALELNLGHHRETVSELAGLSRMYPLRDRLRGELMIALYRCGRSAEALDAYDYSHRTLVAQYGVEPGSALRELRQMILVDDTNQLRTMSCYDSLVRRELPAKQGASVAA